jgi:hypothetical protein
MWVLKVDNAIDVGAFDMYSSNGATSVKSSEGIQGEVVTDARSLHLSKWGRHRADLPAK